MHKLVVNSSFRTVLYRIHTWFINRDCPTILSFNIHVTFVYKTKNNNNSSSCAACNNRPTNTIIIIITSLMFIYFFSMSIKNNHLPVSVFL